MNTRCAMSRNVRLAHRLLIAGHPVVRADDAPELFEKIILDYVEMGGGDVALTPSVGDIFLDKKLVGRINHLKSIPAIKDLGFVTNAGNAGVFSGDELDTIVNACRRINISIYGLDEEENAAMTRRPGTYEKDTRAS